MNSVGSTENRIILGDPVWLHVRPHPEPNVGASLVSRLPKQVRARFLLATPRLFRVRQPFWSLKFLSALSDGRGELGEQSSPTRR
jgi:hypothetical protein